MEPSKTGRESYTYSHIYMPWQRRQSRNVNCAIILAKFLSP